jgi:L-idonate 5-dehydrogenase
LPVVLGHEFAGRVAAVGAGVTNLSVGQAVMAEGSWPGPDASAERQTLGRAVDGCFAEAVAVPATVVHALPPGLEPLVAQSATTLATSLHAIKRAGVLRGRRVAIVGPGHAGLLLLQAIRLQAPRELVLLGTRADRLAIAQKLGADAVVAVARDMPAAELRGEHQDFDVVFEAAGKPGALSLSMALCRFGGTVVCYGIIDRTLDEVSGYPLYARELTLVGSRGAADCYQAALELLAEARVQVLPLVTHIHDFDHTPQAVALALDRSQPVLRVVLTPRSTGDLADWRRGEA